MKAKYYECDLYDDDVLIKNIVIFESEIIHLRTMSQNVGVRQGDCMAPVLFLFMVMAFAETLEK